MNQKDLAALLRANACSLTKTARKLGVTPQRVQQMVKEQGLVILKRVARVPRETSSKKAARSKEL